MLRIVGHVVAKEFRETSRDPHVLLYLLFPILLYPMLVWGSIQVQLAREGWKDTQDWQIDVVGPQELVDAVLESNVAATGGLDGLRSGEVDLVVRATISGELWDVSVRHSTLHPRSVAAREQITERLAELRTDRMERQALAAGLTAEALHPLEVNSRLTSSNAEIVDWIAGIVLALLVPTALLISGLYPAIDLVVSERERGTIETTLVSAAPRGALFIGRVLAMMGFMTVGAVGNALGLMLTANTLAAAVAQDLTFVWVPSWTILLAVPALLGTMLFVCGTLLVALLPARTFKEGEWLGSAVLTVAIVPLFAAVPALIAAESTPAVLLLPFANTTVALAGAVDGTISWSQALVPTAVNGSMGLVLLIVAAKVSAREDWLYGGHLPGWLGWLRRTLPS